MRPYLKRKILHKTPPPKKKKRRRRRRKKKNLSESPDLHNSYGVWSLADAGERDYREQFR
jgi:hypothetical protein